MTASKEDKLGDKLRKLHAMLGSDNDGERDTAMAKIKELLAKNKKSWNDLTELMSAGGEGLQDDVEPAVAGTSNNHPAPPARLHIARRGRQPGLASQCRDACRHQLRSPQRRENHAVPRRQSDILLDILATSRPIHSD